jgi:hypothetical protein
MAKAGIYLLSRPLLECKHLHFEHKRRKDPFHADVPFSVGLGPGARESLPSEAYRLNPIRSAPYWTRHFAN